MTAPPDDDDGEPEPAPEPRALRAKDVLARSEAEMAALEASLDPTELAELASWFARPSHQVVEEKAETIEGTSAHLDQKYSERQPRIAAACAAVEPRMIALLDRHRAAVDRYTRPIEAPPSVIDESILRIRVPSEEQDAQIGELRNFERDGEIDDALAHAVPQAVLRDLYRAETEFELRFTSPFFEEEAPADPWIELRGVMREKRLMPPHLGTFAEGAAAKREFRALTDGSWVDKVAAVKAARGGS